MHLIKLIGASQSKTLSLKSRAFNCFSKNTNNNAVNYLINIASDKINWKYFSINNNLIVFDYLIKNINNIDIDTITFNSNDNYYKLLYFFDEVLHTNNFRFKNYNKYIYYFINKLNNNFINKYKYIMIKYLSFYNYFFVINYNKLKFNNTDEVFYIDNKFLNYKNNKYKYKIKQKYL
jgi:hypothetical protein